jgi:hypothetical protein
MEVPSRGWHPLEAILRQFLEAAGLANKRDVPYQSLIKTWLAEKLDKV